MQNLPPTTTQPTTTPTPLRTQLMRVGMLVFVVAISVFVYAIRDRADLLAAYGYPGIFVLSILANATVILPAPGLVFVFGAGALPSLSPILVGVIAGLGATLGELSAFMAGVSGQALIENRGLYDRLEGWMKKYGPLTITVLAFLPLPVFDMAGIVAGALKFPWQKFLIYCALGKVPKMILVALAGAYSVDWVRQLLGS